MDAAGLQAGRRSPACKAPTLHRLLVLACLALWLPLAAAAEAPRYRVVKVYDGDTVRVAGPQGDHLVRLVGIDAPETAKGPDRPAQPFSARARSYLNAQARHRRVDLVRYGLDPYRRTLAEVILDGRNLNLEILREGLAEVYRGRTPPELDMRPYRQAEREARTRGKGVWSQGRHYRSPLEVKHPD
jgi:micrococcal nuclease